MRKAILLHLAVIVLLFMVSSAFAGNIVYQGRFDDSFEGLDEGNVYEMSDGSAWLQVSYKYKYKYAYRPEVIIVKEGSNFFLCTKVLPDWTI